MMIQRAVCAIGVVLTFGSACYVDEDSTDKDSTDKDSAAVENCTEDADIACLEDGLGGGWLYSVDSCGNVSQHPLWPCVCGCGTESKCSTDFWDPLGVVDAGYGCVDARSCLKATAECEQNEEIEGVVEVMHTLENTCNKTIECAYHHTGLVPGMMATATFQAIEVTLEANGTFRRRGLGFMEDNGMTGAARCNAFVETTPVHEAWLCAEADEASSADCSLPDTHEQASIQCRD